MSDLLKNKMELTANRIIKRFGHFLVLKNINLKVSSGSAIAITGPNGSGKTTLVKILCNLMAPTRGEVIYQKNGKKIERENIFQYIGLVGPYLQLYQELSAQENIDFFARMRNLKNYSPRVKYLMELFNLNGREHDAVKTYSSGMQQRLKYVCALIHEPEVLFVDEPRSNLDQKGIEAVYSILREQKKDKILVISTNDQEDLTLADQVIQVGVV